MYAALGYFWSMAKIRIAILIFFLSFCIPAVASQDTSSHAFRPDSSSHLRISLIIGSPGNEVWETFGHACIRVVDSSQRGAERDKVYNYGYFDVADGNIIYQFLTRRVRVFLDTITYRELMIEYKETGKGLTEQELILDNKQKEQIVAYLKNNLRNENRYYGYDSFFDNCTTRLRDMLTTVLGKDFILGNALPPNSRLTFRNVLVDEYCREQYKYWFGMLLDFFCAREADRAISNYEVMFMPDYFSKGMDGATINGRKLCGKKTVLFTNRILLEPAADGPFWLFFTIAFITIACLLNVRNPVPGNVVSAIVLAGSGLLGCFMLYTWLLHGEPSWANNLNILWALPTNIVVPFLGPRVKAWYAIVALALIAISIVVHILGIQVLPLYYISFLFLALVWIFAVMYKRNKLA